MLRNKANLNSKSGGIHATKVNALLVSIVS
jgi:hypothetical protein